MTNILKNPLQYFSDLIRNYNANQLRKAEDKKYLAEIWEAIQNDPTISVGPEYDMKGVTYASAKNFVNRMRKLREQARREGRLEDVERKLALAEYVSSIRGNRIIIPDGKHLFTGVFTRIHEHSLKSLDDDMAIDERIREIILLLNEDIEGEYLVYCTHKIEDTITGKCLTVFDLYRA